MRRTKPGEGLMRRAAISDRERRSPELPEVQKAAALRGHAASEKLPQEGTACLCEGAVDKQILLLQRFGKGAAWQLICFGLLQQLPKFLCNERQAFHRPELLGCWLLYLADGREDDLPRVPAVPKIHPVPRGYSLTLRMPMRMGTSAKSTTTKITVMISMRLFRSIPSRSWTIPPTRKTCSTP